MTHNLGQQCTLLINEILSQFGIKHCEEQLWVMPCLCYGTSWIQQCHLSPSLPGVRINEDSLTAAAVTLHSHSCAFRDGLVLFATGSAADGAALFLPLPFGAISTVTSIAAASSDRQRHNNLLKEVESMLPMQMLVPI